jgi:hypothetical protein
MDIEEFRSKTRRAIRNEVAADPWTPAQQNDDRKVEKSTKAMFESALSDLSKVDREQLLTEAAALGRLPKSKGYSDARVQALWMHLREDMMLWLRAVAPLFKIAKV